MYRCLALLLMIMNCIVTAASDVSNSEQNSSHKEQILLNLFKRLERCDERQGPCVVTCVPTGVSLQEWNRRRYHAQERIQGVNQARTMVGLADDTTKNMWKQFDEIYGEGTENCLGNDEEKPQEKFLNEYFGVQEISKD